MAKKKKQKFEFKTVLVYMGIVFTGILFILKIFSKNIGWLDVFAPLLVAFLLIFLVSVLKIAIKGVAK